MTNLRGEASSGKPASPTLHEAANEALIEGASRPPARDPFEVWRTRVRDVRDRRSRQKTPPARD